MLSDEIYETKRVFSIYRSYVALKEHFTRDSYDYFKFNGKVKVTINSLKKRHDKYDFVRLSKTRDPFSVLLANISNQPDIWVGDITTKEGYETYRKWVKYRDSLSYEFCNELNCLDSNFKDNFRVENGQHPKLLKLYITGKIRLETLVILTSVTDIMPIWEKKINDPVLFPSINRKVKKYEPFLTFDRKKIRKILIDKYDNT